MKKYGYTIARIFLGLIFLAAGVSGFVMLFSGPPPQPGLAGQFQAIFFASHWVQFVDGVEVLCAIAFLANRYVALALVVTAAIIFNMFVFHVTMAPIGLPAPLVLTAAWVVIALRFRERLLPLLRPESPAA